MKKMTMAAPIGLREQFRVFVTCCLVTILSGFLAQAQTVTYSEEFTFGVNNNAGSSQVDNWEAFRDALTGVYSSITAGGTQGPDVVCSDPAAVAAIAAALNTDTTTTITCAGRNWNIGTCVGTNELSIDVPVCTCQGASAFTLRPDVDFGGSWGGIGGTCGTGAGGAATRNVSQTLSVTAEALGAPTDADISLTLSPASTSPTVGANTFIDIIVENIGPANGTGVAAVFDLPSGLTFVSDDAGGAYNETTGIWTIGTLAPGNSQSLRIIARVESSGSYALFAEVAAANENDTDSTPGNGALGEDDDDSVTLAPVTPPPPLFCLGRPIQPLVFADPVADSPGASVAFPQVGDVFRFPNVSPGVDALVEVTSFNNGATLLGIDNDGTPGAPVGVPDNFQPTLVGPAGDISVDFQFTFVSTGTSIPGTLDFAGSVIDVDGNSAGLREYIEVSNNIVEFALNGVPVPADPTGPPTRLVTQANTPPDSGASTPSPGRIRFEAETDDTAAGIDPNEPRNIAAAFFTDVSVFEYRVGKFGGATAGRLNSLAFNCPAIDPGSVGSVPVIEEDFGDAPFDASTNPGYGNPIHVIDPSAPIVQIGATNTGEPVAGNSPNASSDTGDDGVTIGGVSLQGQSFQGQVSETVTIAVTNASSDTGLLQAFFDWNRDGDFDDAGEQIATDAQDSDNDGILILNVTPPIDIAAGPSFARFRWATSSVGVQDPAGNGEVEDYAITLVAPVLTIEKTASIAQVTENFTLTYTLTVEETAGVDATDLVIEDIVPAGFTVESIANGGTQVGNTISWNFPGPLNATSASFSFIVRADPVTTDTVITNTGSVTSLEVPQAVTDMIDVTVLDGPTIITDETAPGLCVNQNGTLGGPNFFAAANNGTFGTGSGAPDDTAPADPFSGFISTSGYQYEPNAPNNLFTEGEYAFTSNIVTPPFGSGHVGIIDPENGVIGRFLIVNGSTTDDGSGGSTVFTTTITGLTPNTEYEYSAWFSNILTPATNRPDAAFEFIVDGQVIATSDPIIETADVTWVRVGGLFDSGANTSVTVSLRNTSINPAGNDYLVDNARVIACARPMAELEGSKTVEVFDPLGEGLFALPGNDVTYTITISNIGDGEADDGSLFLIDELPPEVVFFNGDADGPGAGLDPVNFAELVPTGLDPFVFADDVAFSDAVTPPADFASCNYTPSGGYDPAVRFVCFNPKGMLQAGDPDPSFALSFRVRIR